MALFIPKGKVPGRTYSMVLDTYEGTTYNDVTNHIVEWNTPLGCIQKESICILEQFSVDTNGINAVYANMFCIRLLNGAGSPNSYDSTRNQPDNVLALGGFPFSRPAGAYVDGIPFTSVPFTVVPRAKNGVLCGPGFNLQRIRLALEEYDTEANGPYRSQVDRVIYHLTWVELEDDD